MKKTIALLAAILSFNANAQWSLTGNSGTNPNTNFLGTTDNQPLILKTNNTEWMKLTPKGRIIFQQIDNGLGWDNNLFLGGGNDITTGLGNTVVGIGALITSSTSYYNSAFGANALRSLNTGTGNSAFGINSLQSLSTGEYNVAFGQNSMANLQQGDYNVGIGTGIFAMTPFIGSHNTTFGSDVLRNASSGNYNVIIGSQAFKELSTGSNNISIGYNNIRNTVNGNNNIYIGSNIQTSSSNPTNELNIGNWILGNNGTIGIGQFTNQLPADGIAQDGEKYKLFVKDGIKTEKVKVDIAASNGWADYVFDKEYKLMPLNELAYFINKNGHLPEVPTTEEAIKNGIELKEMNILLLKKVEELTLHLIDQNKELKTQKEEINALKKQMNLSK